MSDVATQEVVPHIDVPLREQLIDQLKHLVQFVDGHALVEVLRIGLEDVDQEQANKPLEVQFRQVAVVFLVLNRVPTRTTLPVSGAPVSRVACPRRWLWGDDR